MRIPSLVLSAAAVAVVFGCNKPESELQLTSSSVPPPETYTSSTYEVVTDYSGGPSWGADTYTTQSEPVYYSSSAYGSSAGRMHVVQRRDTLYGLARSYYGDAGQWKKIFQANQDVIRDPNRIQVGMKLVIP